MCEIVLVTKERYPYTTDFQYEQPFWNILAGSSPVCRDINNCGKEDKALDVADLQVARTCSFPALPAFPRHQSKPKHVVVLNIRVTTLETSVYFYFKPLGFFFPLLPPPPSNLQTSGKAEVPCTQKRVPKKQHFI